jgi:hypothetical protein
VAGATVGCCSFARKATLAAKKCPVIRSSEANTAVRICSAVCCSIEVASGSAAVAEADCSGCMMRGCVAERGEVSLECAWDDGKLTPCSTLRVETAFARSLDWLSVKVESATLADNSGL